MTSPYTVTWNLRQLMATQNLFKTTDLVPLLAEKGVALSREQVFRLVTQTPIRLNLDVLGALCEILTCTPNDLIHVDRVTLSGDVAVNDNGPLHPIGDLRPVPATIRRP